MPGLLDGAPGTQLPFARESKARGAVGYDRVTWPLSGPVADYESPALSVSGTARAGRRRPRTQRNAHFSTPRQESQASGITKANVPRKTCHHAALPPDSHMTNCSHGQP